MPETRTHHPPFPYPNSKTMSNDNGTNMYLFNVAVYAVCPMYKCKYSPRVHMEPGRSETRSIMNCIWTGDSLILCIRDSIKCVPWLCLCAKTSKMPNGCRRCRFHSTLIDIHGCRETREMVVNNCVHFYVAKYIPPFRAFNLKYNAIRKSLCAKQTTHFDNDNVNWVDGNMATAASRHPLPSEDVNISVSVPEFHVLVAYFPDFIHK